MSERIWLGALAPLALPHPKQVDTVVRAVEGAGLRIDSVRALGGALEDHPLHRLEAAWMASGDWQQFHRAFAPAIIEDPQVAALELRGERWWLRLPVAPGFVLGGFDDPAAAVPDDGRIDLVATVLDVSRADWGLYGAESRLRPWFTGLGAEGETTQVQLPGLGTITYVSPDLAHQADMPRLREIAAVRLRRTWSGGIALVVRRGEPADIAVAVAARCPELFASWQPAPAFVHGEAPTRVILREPSAGLARYLAAASGAAVDAADQRGEPVDEFTPAALARIERVLRPDLASLPGYVLEGWMAFAGEVAVRMHGGRWQRLFEPLLRWPENLLVLIGDRAYQPAVVLADLCAGRTERTPGDALAALVA